MTEAEAKAKWCPFASARVVEWKKASDTVVNAVWGEPPTNACLASACMAWRWLPGGETRSKIQAIRDHREQHNSTLLDAKNSVEATWVDSGAKGYCGLAGSPR